MASHTVPANLQSVLEQYCEKITSQNLLCYFGGETRQ